jgi:hypothetical protein
VNARTQQSADACKVSGRAVTSFKSTRVYASMFLRPIGINKVWYTLLNADRKRHLRDTAQSNNIASKFWCLLAVLTIVCDQIGKRSATGCPHCNSAMKRSSRLIPGDLELRELRLTTENYVSSSNQNVSWNRTKLYFSIKYTVGNKKQINNGKVISIRESS